MLYGALIGIFAILTSHMATHEQNLRRRTRYTKTSYAMGFSGMRVGVGCSRVLGAVRHIRLAKMPINAPFCLTARGKILSPMNPLGASFVSGVSFRGNPG